MAENLNYGLYINDGNSSLTYQTGAQKFCYDNDEKNCATDGGLYQWQTAMGFEKSCVDGNESCSSKINSGNHQGICPNGWHMPKQNDWYILVKYLGGARVAGYSMMSDETKYSNWNISAYFNENSSDFSAFPSGYRFEDGDFTGLGRFTYFWEATEVDPQIILNYAQ